MGNAAEKQKEDEKESRSDDSIGGGRYAKGEIDIPEEAAGVDLRDSDHAHDWMRRGDEEEKRSAFSEMDEEDLDEFEGRLDRLHAESG